MAAVDRSRPDTEREPGSGSVQKAQDGIDRTNRPEQVPPRPDHQAVGLEKFEAYRTERARAEQARAERARQAGRPQGKDTPAGEAIATGGQKSDNASGTAADRRLIETDRRRADVAATDRRSAKVAEDVRRFVEYRDQRARQLESVERRRLIAHEDSIRRVQARPDVERDQPGHRSGPPPGPGPKDPPVKGHRGAEPARKPHPDGPDRPADSNSQPVRADGPPHADPLPRGMADELRKPDMRTSYERARDKFAKAESIENVDDTGEKIGELVNKWMNRPKPTGAHVGTSDHPVIREASKDADLHGGEIITLPFVIWMLGDKAGRSVREKYARSKESRGTREDGDN
jgi:hypothetical protein